MKPRKSALNLTKYMPQLNAVQQNQTSFYAQQLCAMVRTHNQATSKVTYPLVF